MIPRVLYAKSVLNFQTYVAHKRRQPMSRITVVQLHKSQTANASVLLPPLSTERIPFLIVCLYNGVIVCSLRPSSIYYRGGTCLQIQVAQQL